MEVKSKEKVDRNDDEKADAVGKDTARNEHNERLQSTRERKLQQLRYSYANAIIYTPMNAYVTYMIYIRIISLHIFFLFQSIQRARSIYETN